MNADNPDPADSQLERETPHPPEIAPVPRPIEEPASPPRPILIDSSMLARPRPVELRRDFEHGMSYWQPLTIALILALTVVFILELLAGALASEEAIVAAGALKRERVLAGEIWRLFSAVFLHGSAEHIIGNCLVLYVLGIAVEHAYGSLRMIAIFFLSGLTGSLLSFSLSEGPSVGASGAIFGLIGCLTAFFYRFNDKIYFRDKRLGGVLLFWIGYSVITGFLTPLIDNWAHIGGLIGGAAGSLMLAPLAKVISADQPAAL